MITIAGYGFVGRAHQAAFKDRFDVNIYDPALGFSNFGFPQAVIICVSTPPHGDGSCNVDNVAQVISMAPTNVPILIRSTISLEGWYKIKQAYPKHRISFSPEFLRAQSAVEDFLNTKHIYIGGGDVQYWRAVFKTVFGDDFVTEEIDVEELILAKYFRNSFLATKVAFFNQIYDLCTATDVDYDVVSRIVGADKRIGHSHTQVTEQRGYGGHCFPKDVAAISHTAKLFGVDLSLIQEAARYNKTIRKEQ